jgi:hypothetical protein
VECRGLAVPLRIEFWRRFGYIARLFPIGGQNKIGGRTAPERVPL